MWYLSNMFEKNVLFHTYIFIKIHEIGNHFDIWMVHPSLVDYFLKNVTNSSRKYEHRNIMFTELIKEVLIPFSATQNENTNQISNKQSQEKFQFLGDNHIIFGKQLTFPEHFTAFLLLHLFRSARTINLTQGMFARNFCIKLFSIGLYNFCPQNI